MIGYVVYWIAYFESFATEMEADLSSFRVLIFPNEPRLVTFVPRLLLQYSVLLDPAMVGMLLFSLYCCSSLQCLQMMFLMM